MHQNVMENIWLGRYPIKNGFIDEKKMYDDTKAALRALELDIDPHIRMKDIPVSKRQMLEICRAVSCQARILVLDEPTSSQALSSLDERYIRVATGSIGPIPNLVIIFAILAVITWVVWNKTSFGKSMFAVGGNKEAAEVAGINVVKTIIGVFMYAGVMYGIAAFLEGARIQSVGTATGAIIVLAVAIDVRKYIEKK